MATGRVVVNFSGRAAGGPTGTIIRSLFRFGLPAGVQGVAMNVAGVLLLRFMGSLAYSAEAQAAYAVCYTELFVVHHLDVGRADGRGGGDRRPESRRGPPDRSVQAVQVAARFGLMIAGTIGVIFLLFSDQLLAFFGLHGSDGRARSARQLLRYLSVSGLFITVALTYTGGLQGTGDTKSPLFITLVAQIGVPLGLCFYLQAAGHLAGVGDLAGDRRSGTSPAACSPSRAFTRSAGSTSSST